MQARVSGKPAMVVSSLIECLSGRRGEGKAQLAVGMARERSHRTRMISTSTHHGVQNSKQGRPRDP